MNIVMNNMIIKYDTINQLTELIINGHAQPYLFTERGIEFFKNMPQYLFEISKNEEEYDKLFLEFRKRISKFLYDERDINNICDKLDSFSNFNF